MIFLICGLIIGVVMGLTGAGGALIAIPLFIQFGGLTLKEASVLSLFAVVIASFSNFISQRKEADLKNATIFVLFSALGSFLSNPYKKILPDIYVAVLLALISIYALYSVWFPPNTKTSDGLARKNPHIIVSVMIGLMLGILTTFTGLGGGVLMMPILLSIYGYEQKKAVSTSLLAVSLSSLSSLGIQILGGVKLNYDLNLALLILGILVAAYLLKLLVKKLDPQKMVKVRQIVFTLVVAVAMTKIF